MTVMYLNAGDRPQDFFLSDIELKDKSIPVELSEEFIKEYEDAESAYDDMQNRLEEIYKGKTIG